MQVGILVVAIVSILSTTLAEPVAAYYVRCTLSPGKAEICTTKGPEGATCPSNACRGFYSCTCNDLARVRDGVYVEIQPPARTSGIGSRLSESESAAVTADSPAVGTTVAARTTGPETRSVDGSFSVNIRSDSAFGTIRLLGKDGSIVLTLPNGLRAGDRFSGRVEVFSRKARDAEKLKSFVITIGESRVPCNEPQWTAEVPADASEELMIGFHDRRGRQKAELALPLQPASSKPTLPVFELPSVVDPRRAVAIRGVFDGLHTTTGATFDGRPVPILAEDSQRLVIGLPAEAADSPGRYALAISENGVELEIPVRLITLALRASEPDLRKGQRGRLELEVSGLEGLADPFEVLLDNRDSTISQLDGGDRQKIVVHPSEVAAGGYFRWSDGLFAKNRGQGRFSAIVSIEEIPDFDLPDPDLPDFLTILWGGKVLYKNVDGEHVFDAKVFWEAVRDILSGEEEAEESEESKGEAE